MENKGPYFLTTAIAYTSGRPHIGNTYEIILSDALARFKRMEGYDVFFQTGTDEHGQKIEEKAVAAGVTPQEYVDNIAGMVKSNFDLMNTSYDYFIRTTDEQHVKTVQKIFKRLYDQGDIYLGEYERLVLQTLRILLDRITVSRWQLPRLRSSSHKSKRRSVFLQYAKIRIV